METLKSTLSGVTVGDPVRAHNLTMFPLRGPSVADPGYVTLEKATSLQGVQVTEVGSGTVPELLLTNNLDLPVFILDGEELVGAKQNRVVNLSILVPARTELKIPVTCIEAGRWHFETPEFRPASRTHHPESRACRAREVSIDLAATRGTRRSTDQAAAWAHVAQVLDELDVEAPTGALSDAFERHSHRISEYAEQLGPQDGQTGACFAIGGRLVGLDLFDSPTTLAAELPKLSYSYALDAIRPRYAEADKADGVNVLAFLDSLAHADVQSYKAIGEGTDLRIAAPTVAGAALEAWGRIIHLCAFAVQDETRRDTAAMWPASVRQARRFL